MMGSREIWRSRARTKTKPGFPGFWVEDGRPARVYSGLMLVAAGPFNPWVTSNETFWASFNDL